MEARTWFGRIDLEAPAVVATYDPDANRAC